jgi:hypothetical protein
MFSKTLSHFNVNHKGSLFNVTTTTHQQQSDTRECNTTAQATSEMMS